MKDFPFQGDRRTQKMNQRIQALGRTRVATFINKALEVLAIVRGYKTWGLGAA